MTTLSEGKRIAARGFGAYAEDLATANLIANGYRILERKFTIRGGEIDIIATREDVVVFVEVKARPTHTQAAESITNAKRRRLARAASVWRSRNLWSDDGYVLRGDAILVDRARALDHIEDAFGIEIEELTWA